MPNFGFRTFNPELSGVNPNTRPGFTPRKRSLPVSLKPGQAPPASTPARTLTSNPTTTIPTSTGGSGAGTSSGGLLPWMQGTSALQSLTTASTLTPQEEAAARWAEIEKRKPKSYKGPNFGKPYGGPDIPRYTQGPTGQQIRNPLFGVGI